MRQRIRTHSVATETLEEQRPLRQHGGRQTSSGIAKQRVQTMTQGDGSEHEHKARRAQTQNQMVQAALLKGIKLTYAIETDNSYLLAISDVIQLDGVDPVVEINVLQTDVDLTQVLDSIEYSVTDKLPIDFVQSTRPDLLDVSGAAGTKEGGVKFL